MLLTVAYTTINLKLSGYVEMLVDDSWRMHQTTGIK
jgi:hypothetical protein